MKREKESFQEKIVEVEAYKGPEEAIDYPWRFWIADHPFVSK
jgi:3-methyladenine DNA glycosylase Mpg